MTQRQVIQNREYLPAGEVGRYFGYTRDYILMLSRDGKIDGRKIGHRWYVNLASAEAFFETAKKEREVRREIIREERKAELRTHTAIQRASHPSAALLETVAIVLIGIIIGSSGYLGVQVNQSAAVIGGNISFFEKLAISVYELISPNRSVSLEAPALSHGNLGTTNTEVLSATYPTVAATTTHTSLVVGPGDVFTTTSVESIRDSFSDEVSVSIDPHNPDSGIIIPHFRSGEGEAYRFLMVPVQNGSQRMSP